MTDRELLKLAAKAAGVVHDGVGYLSPTGLPMHWNPLNDDGDALRLAVKLRMTICTLSDSIEVISYDNSICSNEMTWEGEDPYAATRRAIVRAAAEIGKTK